jgi:hypothetical protein
MGRARQPRHLYVKRKFTMKVDFTATPKDQFGAELFNPHKPAGEEVRWPMYEIAGSALLQPGGKEVLTPARSLERYRLMKRLMDEGVKGPMDISTAEAELIKQAVAGIYGPLVLGQIDDAIEGGVKADGK